MGNRNRGSWIYLSKKGEAEGSHTDSQTDTVARLFVVAEDPIMRPISSTMVLVDPFIRLAGFENMIGLIALEKYTFFDIKNNAF